MGRLGVNLLVVFAGSHKYDTFGVYQEDPYVGRCTCQLSFFVHNDVAHQMDLLTTT